jgi:fucose 4-O-acetylase-like acetyltransferase
MAEAAETPGDAHPEPKAGDEKKDLAIETLRGIAIILMVTGHVIGGTHNDGLRVPDDSPLRFLYFCLQYLRMPLFTSISGYLYAAKIPVRGQVGKFVTGKLRRLMLPCYSVATVMYVLQASVSEVNTHVRLSNIWQIYLWPYAQFWFLFALFQIFILVMILDTNGLLSTFYRWGAAILVLIALYLFAPRAMYVYLPSGGPEFLGAHEVFRLLPFFFLGYGMQRYKDILLSTGWNATAAVVFAFAYAFQLSQFFRYVDLPEIVGGLHGLTVGLTGIYLLFAFRRPVKPIARLGHYAFGIYLFHVFGTAGARIAVRHIGIYNSYVIFVVSLACGLALPIAIEFALNRHWLSRRVFLGLR